jgi:hypothetical protein
VLGTAIASAPHRHPRWTRSSRLALFLVSALALSSTPAAAASADQPSTAPLDYQLFIGLEVYVQTGDEVGRIRHISRGKADVVLGETVRTLPLRKLQTQRFDHVAKISRTRVTIQHVRGECVVGELDESMYDVVIDQATRELQAEQEKRGAEDSAAFYAGMNNTDGDQAATEQARAIKEMNERALLLAPRADTDLASQDRFLDLEHQQAAVDATTLKVSFEVSAPQPIDAACVIVFALLRHPVDPTAAIHRVLMDRLPKIGAKPVTVRLERTGLPRGCVIESLGVHIYARGREVSSNIVRGRVDVTREEAVRLQHLTIHAGQSLPPALLAEFLPAEAAAIVSDDQRERRVDLKIDAHGEVIGFAFDRAKPSATDARIETMIRATPFLPALEAGTPIAADHTLRLRDFLP